MFTPSELLDSKKVSEVNRRFRKKPKKLRFKRAKVGTQIIDPSKMKQFIKIRRRIEKKYEQSLFNKTKSSN